jgi:L,D-transpeptidase YbiS
VQIRVNIQEQKLYVNIANSLARTYHISTAAKGIGQQVGSEQTPLGWHEIRAKIGSECPINTVFVDRRPTGEIFSSALRLAYPARDWILTRILWLSGLEKGKNRLHTVDTMRRYIYLHGSPDDVAMGIPGSRGCIRMHNSDIIELFDLVLPHTHVLIEK